MPFLGTTGGGSVKQYGGQANLGYFIKNSVRFRGSATSYFNRTWGTPTNNQIWTFSCWAKLGDQTNYRMQLLSSGITGSPTDYAQFQFIGGLNYQETISSATALGVTTSAVFRDPAAWYHVVLAVDTTQATATNRVKIYVNGVLQTVTISAQVAQNTNTTINKSTRLGAIGALAYNGSYINNSDGYQTESYFIDGQALTPSSFGKTNAITGVWQPAKYTGTYGTNGFYLNFSDNSSNTATTIGKDYSGNGNNWTPNNISVTAGSTYDSMTDVPTLTSATAANYATMNPLAYGSTGTSVMNNGNLSFSNGGAHASTTSTIGVTSGKYYLECTVTTSNPLGLGITTSTVPYSAYPGTVTGLWWVYDNTAGWAINNQTTSPYSGASKVALNQIWQIALDMDNGKAWIGINNVFYDSAGGTTGNPSTGANPTWSSLPTTSPMFFFIEVAGATWAATFGQRSFTYTPPTGYVALNTYNLPASTIKNGAAYMKPVLYTGDGTSNRTITGTGFQPDWLWLKMRSGADDNVLVDSVRGGSKRLKSNTNDAESDISYPTLASDGFVVSSGAYNNSGSTFVAWQWKAGGTAVSNTAGSITSTVSVGATQGFSVVTYTGTGSLATVGHGLGVAPSMMIVKRRDAVAAWDVYHSSIGATGRLYLNTTDSTNTSSAPWNNTAPTSTVFTVGTATDTNASASTIVAYCFAAVAGYSAFGSYTGNGSTDGVFVYLGFRPRYIMTKRTDTTSNWYIQDTSRSAYNLQKATLFAESSVAEAADGGIDFLSNGFKIRNTDSSENASGGTYIYAAFAENPMKYANSR